MIDHFGRNIEYLRLSVTERCTLKCPYCRAESGDCPKEKEMSAEDMMRIVRVMAGLGINKIRLTGGEPLLRRDITQIIKNISGVEGIREIALTTNAQQLPGRSKDLKAAGLTRLNISVDSLKPERYREMTGGGSVEAVITGVSEAIEAGLLPIKLNCVVIRGVNDDEIDDFIELTRDAPIDMRFIELMPLGLMSDGSKRISSDEIIASRPYLIPIAPRYESQPSTDYKIDGYMGRVGFISPMSHSFCHKCNRIRVMSDGMLRPCLGNNAEVSLKEALSFPDDKLLFEVIYNAVYNKPDKHTFGLEFKPEKNMSQIGG